MCYQFYSEIYGLQEQMGVTDFSRMTIKAKEQTIFAPFSQTECSLDVEELTEGNENKTPKVSTTGYASSCRMLEISQVNDIPLGGFTIYCPRLRTFLGEEKW